MIGSLGLEKLNTEDVMPMTLTFLVLASIVAAPSQPQAGQEIVVTGQRVNDTAAALQACIARKCPTVEDINASLAHAENLLLHGNYRGARSVLHQSLGRNKGAARQYPEPVSDLYRANALVASHLGFDRDYESSTYNIYRTLKAGIPVQDHRHLQAKMEIAAMTAKTEGPDRGARAYRAVAEDARAMGREDIAGMAEIRAAIQVYKLAPEAGKPQVAKLMGSRDPFTSKYATLFYATILRSEKKDAEADALVRQALAGLKKPVLIYSPPYELAEQELGSVAKVPGDGADLAEANVLRRPNRNFEKMWIDVSYFVQPDGKVSDVEIVRSEKDTFWAKPLLQSIEGRRYSPRQGGLPYPKLERYTYTAGYYSLTGSRVAARSPGARIEYLDLSL